MLIKKETQITSGVCNNGEVGYETETSSGLRGDIMSYGTDLFPSMLPCLCVCTNAITHTLSRNKKVSSLYYHPSQQLKLLLMMLTNRQKSLMKKPHQVRSYSKEKIAILKYYRCCFTSLCQSNSKTTSNYLNQKHQL